MNHQSEIGSTPTEDKTPIALLLFAIVSILMVYATTALILAYISETTISTQHDSGFAQFCNYTLSFIAAAAYSIMLHRHYPSIHIPVLRGSAREINSPLIVVGVILTIALSIVISPLIDSMSDELIDTVNNYIHGGFWPMLTAIVAAPILEEILFRGVIQKSLVSRFGPIIGIVAGAAIFGAIHVLTQQVIYGFGVGLILGTVYYMTGSLVGAVAIHFVNNGLTTLLYLTFGTASGIERQFLGSGTLWNFVYFCSSLLLIGAATWAVRAINIREKQTKKVVEKI